MPPGGVAHEPMASQPGGRTHQQSAKLWLAHKDPQWWVARPKLRTVSVVYQYDVPRWWADSTFSFRTW